MRKSGILFHIASLPNDYGIGTMGKEAYEFADYLEECGQSIWQILPLSPTSFGDSPYQSFSIFAGNPYFISLETLEEEGLLKKEEYADIKWRESERYIDYGTIYENIYIVLKKAYLRFIKDDALKSSLERFSEENPWVEDYALFMALKSVNGGRPWNEWDEPLRIRMAWQSTADIAMTTIQEMCGYGSEARINIPSTIGNNWRWRAVKSDFSAENADMLNRLTEICNRHANNHRVSTNKTPILSCSSK